MDEVLKIINEEIDIELNACRQNGRPPSEFPPKRMRERIKTRIKEHKRVGTIQLWLFIITTLTRLIFEIWAKRTKGE